MNKRSVFYILLIACFVALPLSKSPYWIDLGVNIGLYTLLALSLNVILGQAGIFNMGHMAFYAVGAYATAILNTVYHWPVLWTMPVAGCAAALFAAIVARPIIHLRGDYLLIVTIGIVEIVRIALLNNVFGLTGGHDSGVSFHATRKLNSDCFFFTHTRDEDIENASQIAKYYKLNWTSLEGSSIKSNPYYQVFNLLFEKRFYFGITRDFHIIHLLLIRLI